MLWGETAAPLREEEIRMCVAVCKRLSWEVSVLVESKGLLDSLSFIYEIDKQEQLREAELGLSERPGEQQRNFLTAK